MTVNELIDAFGGTTAMARAFEVKPNVVSMWRRHGLPDRASFYFRLRSECARRGIEVSERLFASFIVPPPEGRGHDQVAAHRA